MVRLSKEGRQVGRDGVDEVRQFCTVALDDEVAVGIETTESQAPQPARQSAVTKLAFLVREGDPGMFSHAPTEGLKMPVGKVKLPLHGGRPQLRMTERS